VSGGHSQLTLFVSGFILNVFFILMFIRTGKEIKIMGWSKQGMSFKDVFNFLNKNCGASFVN
jgi:hypothetical protein